MYKKIVNKLLNVEPNKTDVLHQLMKKPKPEKNDDMPKFHNYVKDNTHQADLLFLPEDKSYKYLLVVVDESTRLIDCEPLKNKESLNIVKAFKKIYSRSILHKPKHIDCDSGSEFKGATADYFKSLDIGVRYADPNRHRQQALVENANQKIGKIIFMLQNHKELQTKKQCKIWVSFLRNIISELNDDSKEKNKQEKKPITFLPIITENNNKILNKDDKVRILLDHPIDIHNSKKLSGKFRSGDIKWSLKVYKITEILIRPTYPPMYLTSKSKTTEYTTQQLQVIP